MQWANNVEFLKKEASLEGKVRHIEKDQYHYRKEV